MRQFDPVRRAAACVIVVMVGATAPAARAMPPVGDGAAILEEVWALVQRDFFDPGCNGVEWAAIRAPYVERAAAASDHDDLAAVVNESLALLDASHTQYYPPTTTQYYDLLDIFNFGELAAHAQAVFPDGVVRYCGIGVITTRIGDGVFISDVIDGAPAADADLHIGDRLRAVDGAPFHPILSFRGKAGTAVRIRAQRTHDPDDVFETSIVPRMIVPGEMYLASVRHGARIHERDGRRLGAVRLRSYAGPHYHERLQEILRDELADADGLVLDLRGGWGGASAEYLNLFNTAVPVLEHITREGERRAFDTQWRRPVVLLVDEGSRSGKEVYAYGFRKHGIGPVVGTRTAGAVVGGRPYLLGNGAILYLAVIDARVDGERLEGIGVTPDVPVEFTLPYAAGADPQMERALEVLAEEVRKRGDP